MFRDVIVMSFNCPHCGYSNNEIQEGSPIQDNGVRYTITVNKQQVQLERKSLQVNCFVRIWIVSWSKLIRQVSRSLRWILRFHLLLREEALTLWKDLYE